MGARAGGEHKLHRVGCVGLTTFAAACSSCHARLSRAFFVVGHIKEPHAMTLFGRKFDFSTPLFGNPCQRISLGSFGTAFHLCESKCAMLLRCASPCTPLRSPSRYRSVFKEAPGQEMAEAGSLQGSEDGRRRPATRAARESREQADIPHAGGKFRFGLSVGAAVEITNQDPFRKPHAKPTGPRLSPRAP